MRRRQCDAQGAARRITGQHHDNERRAGFLGQIFGVAGKVHAGLVDDPFMHRCRHHRRKLAGQAASERTIEQFEHMAAVGSIELAGLRRPGQRNVQHIETAAVDRVFRSKIAQDHGEAERPGTGRQQLPVAKDHGRHRPVALGQAQAKLRANAGRLAAGHGNAGQPHFSSSRFST